MALLPPDPKYLLRGDMQCVQSLLFRVNPYIEHLFTGTARGKVYIWDLKKNRVLKQFTAGEDSCLSMHIFGESNLITQQKASGITVWKAAESQWVLDKFIDNDCCNFCRCQLLSNDVVLIPLRNSVVGLLSLKDYTMQSKLDPSEVSWPGPFGEVMAIKPLTIDNKQLVLVAYESGHLILWDVEENKAISYLKTASCPMAIDFDSRYRRGVLGDTTDKIQVFTISADYRLTNGTIITIKNPGTSVLTIRSDAKVFTAGGWDGRLRIFSWKSLRQLATLDQHKGAVQDIIYSPCAIESYNSKCLMAAAGKDGYISLWDLYN